MKKIDLKLLNDLSIEAAQSKRKRKNYNLHDDLSDTLQRLLNAMEPGTYVQPHKHENPDKREVFTIIRGSVAVIIFENTGEIKEHIILDQKSGNFGVEIPAKTWHTIIALERGTVVFEIKDGPYHAIDDKNFANWAPSETDENCIVYNNNLLKAIGLI